MYHLFQGLRPLLALLHMAVVLLAVYWTIMLSEGAHFWRSVRLEKQVMPVLSLAIAYGLIALFTNWLIRYRRPLLSQLHANRQALIIYFRRSYLIPFIPILILPMAYEMLQQRAMALAKDLPALVLMSLVLLMLFSLVNQLALARYFLAVNARAGAIVKLRQAKPAPEGNAAGDLGREQRLRTAGVVQVRSSSELAAYMAFSLQERRVMAYDEQGQTVLLRFRSLRMVKDELQGDTRFFMKGNWILRYDALERQELIPGTRTKKLYLKYTSNYFILNKNDVSDFTAWLEKAHQTWDPEAASQ